MKKLVIFLIMILLGIGLLIIMVNAVNKVQTNRVSRTTWTKAICSEKNYCLDVEITCDGNKVIDIRPIDEGFYFSNDWKDPRSSEMIGKWC